MHRYVRYTLPPVCCLRAFSASDFVATLLCTAAPIKLLAGAATRTASFSCRDAAGSVYADGTRSCGSAAPAAVTQDCNLLSCPTWKSDPWSACSVSCGSGRQTRATSCVQSDGVILDDSACSSQRPTTSQYCSVADCPTFQFTTGNWSACSQTCGEAVQERTVTCVQTTVRGNLTTVTTVNEARCLSAQERPIVRKDCYIRPCTEFGWASSQWGVCSVTCGEGVQRRVVSCMDSSGKTVADSSCGSLATPKPDSVKSCQSACLSFNYTVTPWSSCSTTCLQPTGRDSTAVQTRIVQCVNQYGMVVDEGKCSSSGQLTRPQAARDCCLESPLYPGQCVGYIPQTPVPTPQPSAAPTDFPTFTDAPTVITRPPTGTPTRAFPLCATANLASPFNDITEGLITFYQAYYGAPTQVTLKVVGSVGTVGGGKSFGEYHIHDFAVNPNDPNGPCSVTSVGGHYNPTNIADYKLCNPNVPSTCEVGDLSGKFGYLQGSFESRTFIDRGLDVASIIQRSLVIHDNGGERWVCGTIVDDASSNFGRRRKCLFYDLQLQCAVWVHVYLERCVVQDCSNFRILLPCKR